MKKALRVLSALLAFCVLAAGSPLVGLAADPVDDLRSLIDQATSGVLDLGGASACANDVSVGGSGRFAPFIIDKPITIQNGSVTVRAGGIVLGADVTFSNIEFSFPSGTEGGNFIAANGRTLTLKDVSCASNAHSFSLFCGTFTGKEHPTVSVPAPRTDGTIILEGAVDLQGGLSAGNIYAGNVYRTTDGNNSPEKVFQGDATISVESSSGDVGTIYACGATQTNGTANKDETYTVSGSISITGDLPNVDGAGAGTANVVYRGNGYPDPKTFQDISSLSVKEGSLVLNTGSWFRDDSSLTVSPGATVNIKDMDSALSISELHGGGSLILGQTQTLTITGAVDGRTTIGVGKIFNEASDSPTLDHTYIIARGSDETSFRLAPPNILNPPVLERDGSGNWIAKQPVQEASKLVSLAPPANTQVSSGETEITILLNPIYTTEAGLNWEDLFSSIQICINGQQAQLTEDTDYPEYSYYTASGLRLSIGDYRDGASFAICDAGDPYVTPVPDGTYTIEITVSGGEHTATGADVTASCTLTVGDSAPAVKTIPVPQANTGLKWTGAEQTGVEEGTGYTLTGHKGTEVGDHTATARLQVGYQWTGGGTADETIPWSIAKADGPAAPHGLSAVAPTQEGGTDGQITGTTSAMEYDTDGTFANAKPCGDPNTTGLTARVYYVRVKETQTHQAGAGTAITVPEPGAPTVQSISVNSTAHKTEYVTGDALNVTDLTIEVVYSDDSRKTVPVTKDMVSGFDSSSAAEKQELTIIYEGMTAAYTIKITASEEPGKPRYQVTLEGLGDGGSGEGSYEEGSTVTIRAGSKSGHTFSAWQQPEGVTLADRNSPETSFTMPGKAVTLQATWKQDGGSSSGGGSSGGGGSSSGGGSSAGGGSWSGGPSGSTSTVKDPDGSTKTTSTNKVTGTVTETTRRPDGSKTVVETKKDGTVTRTDTGKDGSTVKTLTRPDGTSETTVKQANGLTASVREDGDGASADVRLPSKVVQESQSGGGAVVLPIPALPGADSSITIRTGSARPVRVEIPVRGDEDTTVACLVGSDGSETILKTAVLAGGQIAVSIPDGATVHIRDNGGDFQDTGDHWAKSAIDFVSARELFSGKAPDTFDPEGSMSRVMLMTVLARLDGLDATGGSAYEKGLAWAVAQGISDGQSPDGQVTREQFLVMLHRYAGNPAATERELRFSDTEEVSAYAREAVRWAAENGILNGYADGSVRPGGRTTRAQAAAILARYVKCLDR